MPYLANEESEEVSLVKSVKYVISISRFVKQVMQSCSHRWLVQSMRGDGMAEI
jgi:hypothetical protein